MTSNIVTSALLGRDRAVTELAHLKARIAELELQVASAHVLAQTMLDGEATGLVRAQLQALQATLNLEGRPQP